MVDFSPFVLEYFGAMHMGPSSKKLFASLAGGIASSNSDNNDKWSDSPSVEWRRRLAVRLHTGNAKGLLQVFRRILGACNYI